MNLQNLIKNKEKKIERFKYLDNKGQNILPVDEKKRDNWYEWFELKKKLPVLKASLKALKQMNKIWEDKLKDEGIMFHEGKICFDEKASPKFAKWLDKLLDKREKYTNNLWLDKIDKKIKYWKKEEQKWNNKKLEAFEKKDKYEGMYLGKANEVREIIRILKELKSKDKK